MKLSLCSACCVIALFSGSALAQAPARSPYDGVYQGVSRHAVGGSMSTGRSSGCDPDTVPAPLTVSGGVARAGSQQFPLQGSVTPQGGLVMRSAGGHFEGQIDARGQATGLLILNCSYQMTWQRR